MSKTPKTWYAVDVTVDPQAAEAVESAFNELDALGTEVDSLMKKPGEPLRVTGFFETEPDENGVRSAVYRYFEIYGLANEKVRSVSVRVVEETDWLAEWKRHWVPQNVGRFTIAPPWRDVPASDNVVIRIEPNMAFGTGTHETTKLCLRAISELCDPPVSFLDVGTGTGILAIAAAKLGGDPIFACDVDRDSVKIARENAAANGVSDLIRFAEGSITDQTPEHDLVCANLTLDVILPLLPAFRSKTRKTLILSGILAEQEHLAADAIDMSVFKGVQIKRDGEWIAIIVHRVH